MGRLDFVSKGAVIMAPKSLLREPLKTFKPYVAGKPIEEVRREYGLTGRIAKLASNENPLGTSPKALDAMHKAIEQVGLYPDDHSYYFRKKVAERYDVKIENIFAASGSVEVLELAGIAFLEEGDEVITSAGSFAIYYLTAMKAGAKLNMVPMTDGGYRYDIDGIINAITNKTKIIFLANPNNPTGTWFTDKEFDRLMAVVPEDVLVVYDSAYQGYFDEIGMPDPMTYMRAGRRVMLLRTFSKAQGLAGIRIGYGVGPEDIVAGLMTCRFPFNANLVAQAGAMAAMDDTEFVERSRKLNDEEIAYLLENLVDLPVTIPPSHTNFILIDTPKNATWLFTELQKIGVIVRPMGGNGFPGAIRVSTGLREDDERFVKHFRRLIESDEGWLKKA
jgi:histidinol-phosphate aminotransferase